jgi:hypothetical protein
LYLPTSGSLSSWVLRERGSGTARPTPSGTSLMVLAGYDHAAWSAMSPSAAAPRKRKPAPSSA